MSDPFEGFAGLDKLIHEPARLAITSALASCDAADFLYLQRLTGLTKGNLSAHLAKLAAAGLVEIDKGFVGRVPQTRIALTEAGRAAVDDYWSRLEELRDAARTWPPERPHGETDPRADSPG